MLQRLLKRIPQKHRFLAILITSSVIGVVLLLVAVYNASKGLERLHDVDNLYRFVNAQLHSGQADTGDVQHLLLLGELGYRVMVVRGDRLLADNAAASGAAPASTPAALEATRVNERGGYFSHDGRSVTWTRVPLPDNSAQLFVLHDFASGDADSLVQVYARHLLIPAALYIWLMTWMGCTLSFLTDKLSRQKKEMEHMALHDALSGLPNRILLCDRLNTMVEMSKRHETRFSLAMIDLDGFKNINDSLGHDAGDTLLQSIAQRLSGCIRSVDTVARVGGDEFVLLLDGLDTQASREICERAAAEIARPVPIGNAEVCVGASIGIAVFPDHGDNAETLTCNADQAMYAVKAKGGGIQLYCSASASEKATWPQPRAVPA